MMISSHPGIINVTLALNTTWYQVQGNGTTTGPQIPKTKWSGDLALRSGGSFLVCFQEADPNISAPATYKTIPSGGSVSIKGAHIGYGGEKIWVKAVANNEVAELMFFVES